MQTDQKIVSAAVHSREAFSMVEHHLQAEELGPQAEAWWPLLEKFYRQDAGAQMADIGILRSWGERYLPAEHHEMLLGWFDDLKPEASPRNVAWEILDSKRAAKGRELAAAILSGRESGKLVTEYQSLMEATELEEDGAAEGYWADDDVRKLIDDSRPENLIPVFPKSFRRAAQGGVEPGDHIVVFARPEMGKSLFALNMSAGWARTGHRVLYIGNEDHINKLKRRLICNLANMTPEEMRKWPDQAAKRARDRGLDNVKMWWQNGMTMNDLERKIQEVEPDCVVLDQIRGMGGTRTGDGMTQKLQEVAIGFRRLLGKYSLVGLSTNQGNDRTERHGQEPPAWLKMGDVADSRTDLPGQADWLLGIGADQEMKDMNKRACSVLKAKGEGSHEGFTFYIDPLRSKVT